MAISHFFYFNSIKVLKCPYWSSRLLFSQGEGKYKNEYHLISSTIPLSTLSITTFGSEIETEKSGGSPTFTASVAWAYCRCECWKVKIKLVSYKQWWKRESQMIWKKLQRENKKANYTETIWQCLHKQSYGLSCIQYMYSYGGHSQWDATLMIWLGMCGCGWGFVYITVTKCAHKESQTWNHLHCGEKPMVPTRKVV